MKHVIDSPVPSFAGRQGEGVRKDNLALAAVLSVVLLACGERTKSPTESTLAHTVSITGPRVVAPHESGTWTANLSPYSSGASYSWTSSESGAVVIGSGRSVTTSFTNGGTAYVRSAVVVNGGPVITSTAGVWVGISLTGTYSGSLALDHTGGASDKLWCFGMTISSLGDGKVTGSLYDHGTPWATIQGTVSGNQVNGTVTSLTGCGWTAPVVLSWTVSTAHPDSPDKIMLSLGSTSGTASDCFSIASGQATLIPSDNVLCKA